MWLTLTIGFFGLAVALHAALCRIPLRSDFVVKSLLAGAPIGLALAAILFANYGFGIQTAAALLLYALIFEIYIFSFTLVSTSVSVSLLLKLRSDSLTSGEIENLYSTKDMVDDRMVRMLRANLLTQDGSEYRVTSKARMLLGPFRLLRFFFHRPSAKAAPPDPCHPER